MATIGKKLDDLARVTYLGQGDGITGTGHVEFCLLGSGQVVAWRPNGVDYEWIMEYVAPLRLGDEVALQGFLYGDVLRRVRYTCRGRSFRGARYHERLARQSAATKR